MPIGDISFTKGEGGLGLTLPGKDHYAGLVFYSDTKPATWPASNIKLITTLADAEDIGITSDAADATLKKIHYHLARFFDVYTQKNIKAKLWLMIADVPEAAYDYSEITTLVDEADGDIRLIGIDLPAAFATTQVTAMQAVVNVSHNAHKPVSVLMTANFKDIALVDLPDLRALNSKNISVSIGQDGNNLGKALYTAAAGASIGNIGSLLAWSSSKNVSYNIGWPEKFDTVISSEYDVPAFANGELVKENQSKLDDIHDKGYIFLMKRVGSSGTYFNESSTCTLITSDYAYLENNQVIDKAIRGAYVALLPKISSPISIDPDTGKIEILTVSYFENLVKQSLQTMVSALEISGFGVYIDPDQDVLSTSKLKITITLVINGVARNIDVDISFVKSVN